MLLLLPSSSPASAAPTIQCATSPAQVAFAGDAWDAERATKVQDLFDGMAHDWHNRLAPERYQPLEDALARGNVSRGTVAEMGSGLGDSTSIIEAAVGPVVAIELSMEMRRPATAVGVWSAAQATRSPTQHNATLSTTVAVR